MFLVFTVFKSNLLAVFYMVCAEKIFYGLNTHGIIFFIANAIFAAQFIQALMLRPGSRSATFTPSTG